MSKFTLPIILIVLLGLSGLVCSLGYIFENNLFKPWKRSIPEELKYRKDLKFKKIVSYNSKMQPQKINTCFRKSNKSKKCIYMLHGNAGDIYLRCERSYLFSLPHNLFIIDYQGFGESTGECNEQNTYMDAVMGWKYLTKTLGFKPKDIYIVGESIGGAIAIYLTDLLNKHNTKIGGLILQSTFYSMDNLVKDLSKGLIFYPINYFCVNSYPSDKRIQQFYKKTKILILHGTEDELISVKHAYSLYNLVKRNLKNKLKLVRGSHNHVDTHKCKKYIQMFIK